MGSVHNSLFYQTAMPFVSKDAAAEAKKKLQGIIGGNFHHLTADEAGEVMHVFHELRKNEIDLGPEYSELRDIALKILLEIDDAEQKKLKLARTELLAIVSQVKSKAQGKVLNNQATNIWDAKVTQLNSRIDMDTNSKFEILLPKSSILESIDYTKGMLQELDRWLDQFPDRV